MLRLTNESTETELEQYYAFAIRVNPQGTITVECQPELLARLLDNLIATTQYREPSPLETLSTDDTDWALEVIEHIQTATDTKLF